MRRITTDRAATGSRNTIMLWCLVLLVWMCVGVCGMSSQEQCLELFETYQQGIYVCGSHPDLVPALQIAENMAREECQAAFEMERWNCSGFSILKAPNITNRVTKEAAYVDALSLAAIAHSVAKMCALRDVTSCSCDQDSLDLPQVDSNMEYEMGCSDNVEFGITFATHFLQLRHSGQGLQQDIKAHNMRLGANVVKDMDEVPYMCRCVGVSGSCALQTCQYELPEFGVIANRMRELYFNNHTCKVKWNNIVGPGAAHLYPSGCENELWFLHDSPDYCDRNEAVGSSGTSGRECNPHLSTGPSSCNYLCTQCNRRHTSAEEEVTKSCWCEFLFCCEIQCRECSEIRHYHVCT